VANVLQQINTHEILRL